MKKIIFIIGLPGSGKSHYCKVLKSRNPQAYFFDDFKSNAIKDCRSFPFSIHYVDLINKLNEEALCIVTDIDFCRVEARDEAKICLDTLVDNIQIEWHFFENDPEKCLSNIENSTRNSPDRLEKLNEFTDLYTLPKKNNLLDNEKLLPINDFDSRKALKKFVRLANQLNNRRYIIDDGLAFEFKIYQDNKDHSWKYDLKKGDGDEDHYEAFLINFRKFILENEDVFINKVFNNAISCMILFPEYQNRIKELKNLWKHYYLIGDIQMKVGDIELTPKEAINLLLYGDVIHNEDEKENLIKELRNNPIPSLDVQLGRSLPKLINIINLTSQTISEYFLMLDEINNQN